MFLKLIKKIASIGGDNRTRARDAHSKMLEITSTSRPKLKSGESADEKFSTREDRSETTSKEPQLRIPSLYGILSGKIEEKERKLLQRATIAGILVLLLISVRELRMAAFLIALMLLAAVSKLIQEPIPFVVGLDLCLFVTTVVGYAIHPVVGFIIGGTASIIGSFLRQTEAVENIVVPVLGYFWSSIAVWILHAHASLWEVGVVTTLLYTIHNVIIFGYLRHFSIHSLTFMATSIPFNLFLISRFGEKLASLLT